MLNVFYTVRNSFKTSLKVLLLYSFFSLDLYVQTVGLILVGVVIATKALAFFSEPHILIGTAVCGSILVLIAVFGLVGAVKHHQIILFFVS